MAKALESARVTSQIRLAEGVYSMWIETRQMAEQATPGQFLSLYSKDSSKLLPRPISICEVDKENGRLRIVYRILGSGTEEFSHYKEGDLVEIMGPLGNGFPLEVGAGKKAFLIGGGIGIPPMLELAKQLACEKQIILGYRDSLFLNEEFLPYGDTFIATEDGSQGTKGNVLNAIEEHQLKADVIYACGPTPMLKAIKAYALEHKIECYLSLEERMACGIGACLACVCKSTDVDDHSKVKNKRVCKDGPVFRAEEVDFS
ncbi:dihydroorotate dehydrogenase electron transfer subunit [Clostridium sp. HBUAS56010]|uniref:dihydroorotate dehydrogenase electron transfer subunit n=1 Tax=Clostridium sp. HBUAS56010 TaxID=2571127 RepID=UPI001177B7ED|nr:dihydroorotate dehydrogenase electron transfer subunit [Clostridium sp. HBUAS56010]